jgi:hypothetical protein
MITGKHRKVAGALLVMSLLACAVAFGDEIITSDGKVYRDVTVERVEPDGIAVTYRPQSGGVGMAKIRFCNLPETLRHKYGYDEMKAAAFEACQARAQAALQVKMQADDAECKTRLAKRLAQEELEWRAEQAVKARSAVQQVSGGGSNNRQRPLNNKQGGLPQEVIKQIENEAAARAVSSGMGPAALNAAILQALRNAGASSQQLQQVAAQRGAVSQNRSVPAAPRTMQVRPNGR